jgi:succinate dehydrogenase / fumarate reductase cytochrome b subunit
MVDSQAGQAIQWTEFDGLTIMTLASILKKVLMALTGLVWFGFVIAHLSGNLLLYKGPESFNGYSDILLSNPLLIPAEIALVIFLLVHFVSALRVTRENKNARPQGYVRKVPSTGSSTFASRTMWYGGAIVLLFVITHVWMFKFGNQTGEHGLWGLVISSFKNPLIAIWYIFAMLLLGLHLSHGFASAFQTLGILQSRWQPGLRKTGVILGWVIAIGFILFPLWAFFFAKV